MTVRGLVLFPGAGSSSNQSTLVAIENAVLPVPTFRRDFPYRRAGRKIPDRSPVLVQCVIDEVGAVAEQLRCETTELVVGGHSMGGRMCTMAIAGEAAGFAVRGVICVSYPLHPPRKPSQLRVGHLPRLDVASLFISGTRDGYGSPEKLVSEFSAIPTPPAIEFIEGGRHDLKGHEDRVAAIVKRWLLALQ